MSRVVIKIGTSSLTDGSGIIDRAIIYRMVDEIHRLRADGHVVTVVTSGAIAAGMPVLSMSPNERPADPVALQALSSIGQPALVRSWSEAFAEYDIVIGQILLAPHNFGDRAQYLHARSTLTKLHEMGVVPLINENDAVTDAEIRFGDNDRIAALVAQLVDAEILILLTDTDGVLTADPRNDPEASLIEEIVEFDQHLESLAGGAGSARGSGGMASKITAAKIAAWSGVRTLIANARRPDVLVDVVNGVDGIGTTIQPRATRLPARKLWIGFAMPVVATVTVDDGAVEALVAGGRSLLAVGVLGIDGEFESGDAIEIATPAGDVFAKGLARLSSTDLQAMQRVGETATSQVQRSMVVHVDDLIVIT